MFYFPSTSITKFQNLYFKKSNYQDCEIYMFWHLKMTIKETKYSKYDHKAMTGLRLTLVCLVLTMVQYSTSSDSDVYTRVLRSRPERKLMLQVYNICLGICMCHLVPNRRVTKFTIILLILLLIWSIIIIDSASSVARKLILLFWK